MSRKQPATIFDARCVGPIGVIYSRYRLDDRCGTNEDFLAFADAVDSVAEEMPDEAAAAPEQSR